MVQGAKLRRTEDISLSLCVDAVSCVDNEFLKQWERFAVCNTLTTVLSNVVIVEVKVLKLREVARYS